MTAAVMGSTRVAGWPRPVGALELSHHASPSILSISIAGGVVDRGATPAGSPSCYLFAARWRDPEILRRPATGDDDRRSCRGKDSQFAGDPEDALCPCAGAPPPCCRLPKRLQRLDLRHRADASHPDDDDFNHVVAEEVAVFALVRLVEALPNLREVIGVADVAQGGMGFSARSPGRHSAGRRRARN